MGHIRCLSVSRLISAALSEGPRFLCMRWRGGVEGVLLLPLPVCLQSHFRQCQHVLAPTGALPCCCTGCCVAGREGQWGHLRETEEQTGSQRAGQYSTGYSLPQSGVLWQLSVREVLQCSRSSGHQLGWRGSHTSD